MLNCPKCGLDILMALTRCPFGEDITCPECEVRLETDWDYIDDEDGNPCPIWWATKEKKPNKGE